MAPKIDAGTPLWPSKITLGSLFEFPGSFWLPFGAILSIFIVFFVLLNGLREAFGLNFGICFALFGLIFAMDVQGRFRRRFGSILGSLLEVFGSHLGRLLD